MKTILYHWLRRAGGLTEENIPLSYIALFLPETPIVVDAGAHNGSDTVQMSRLWPRGTIHAFEPVPAVFSQLEACTRSLANVRRHACALAGACGTMTMYVSSGGTDASSSLLAPKEHLAVNPHVIFQQQIAVPTQTLDAWAAQNECPQVDFLWLDMQGGELTALQAAPRVLATVRAIHLEVAVTELYENNPLYPDVQAWLESQGFLLVVEEIAHTSGGNAFFVRAGVRLSLMRLFLLAIRKLSPRLRRR